MKKMTKKQVFILYGIIIAVMFVTVFFVNLTIGYSTVKEALVSGGMFTAPVALLGAGTGFMILFWVMPTMRLKTEQKKMMYQKIIL